MEKSRKILALTGIRSEYDLQYSIAKSLCQYENVDFRFLVFGAHLSNIFGKTVENILNDNFNIYETVETNPNDDSYGGKVKTISILLNTLSEILKNYKYSQQNDRDGDNHEFHDTVKKTKKLVVVDSGWISSGFSAELVAKVIENIEVNCLTSPPVRVALQDAPAPTASVLEKEYYTSVEDIILVVKKLFKK